MAKLTLADLVSLANQTTAITTINANHTLIENALENTLSRDGTSPNAMGASLDMNSNRILNLPFPSADTEPLRKGDLATLADAELIDVVIVSAFIENLLDDTTASAARTTLGITNSTFKQNGAVGNGTTDDTAAINTALALGVPIDGEGLTYGVTGNITLPAGTYIKNAVFKQLTPGAAGDVRTLTATSVTDITLENVKVNRNGNGTNGALSDDAGIYISACTNVLFYDVEVTGDDMGTGIAIINCFRVRLEGCYCHDMNYSLGADPLDDRVQAFWLNGNSDVELIGCRVHDLGGNFGSGATTRYSRSYVFSGNTSMRVHGCHAEDADQGFDNTGSAGNSDFVFSACTTRNMRSYGYKWAGSNRNGLVTGCYANRSGYAGFIITDGNAGERTRNISFVDCFAKDTGYNGVYAASSPTPSGFLAVETNTYPRNLRFVGCYAIDEQGTPTQTYGFNHSGVAGTSTGYVINCSVSGFLTAAYAGFVTIGRQSDTFAYYSAQDVLVEGTITAAGRALLDDADATAQRVTLGLVIGTNVQAYDAELAALAGLTSAADSLPYFTGSGTAALASFTAAGRALVDDADASAQRTTLGLGTIATQNANNVALTGGAIDGATVGSTTAAAGKFTTLEATGAVVFNDAGAAVNFRVETDSDANMINVDGTNNRIGFGTAPSVKFHFSDTANVALRIDATDNNSSGSITLLSKTSGGVSIDGRLLTDNGGAVQFGSFSAHPLDIRVNSTVVASFSTAGIFSYTGSQLIASATAVPAGGTAGLGYKFSSTSNLGLFFGSGAPTLAAAQGSLYIRTDGSSTSTRLYVNTNGSTTWTNVTTAV